MEEVKYHHRFHQANMSHLLNIFNRSKNVMLVMMFHRLLFEQNLASALGILVGYIILVACIHRLEKSNIANTRSVLVITHFITFVIVLTCISCTLCKNKEPPKGIQTGVVICLIFTLEAMKAIEPCYVKASAMFGLYWGLYLVSL